MALERNPLQISLILSEIFKKLNFEDQKNFRLVCKIWMDSTLGYWRGSSALILIIHGTNYDFGAFLRLVKKGKDQLYRIEEFPFRQFKIARRFYILEKDEEMRFLTSGEKTFYQLVGHEIEYLEFKQCAFESFIVFEGLRWILLNFGLVNLKELVFTGTQFRELGKIQPQPDFNAKSKIKYALPAAENLKTLKFGRYYYVRACGFFPEQQHLGQVDLKEVLDIVPNLKNLFLDNLADQLLIALGVHADASEKPVKLESLIFEKISQFLESVETEAFAALEKYWEIAKPSLKQLQIGLKTSARKEPFPYHRFLQACGNTITSLKLDFYPSNENQESLWLTDLTGRAFPNLTRLYVTFKESDWYYNSAGKFDFEALRGMPSLRSFTCVTKRQPKKFNWTLNELQFTGSAPWVGTQVDSVEEIKLDQLTEFHYCLRNKFGAKSLKTIAEWMKNLKSLKLVLNKKAFEIIPELFPDLEELTLLRGSTVGEDDIQEVRDTRRSLFITVEEGQSEPDPALSHENFFVTARKEKNKRLKLLAERKKRRAERAAAAPVRRSQRIKKS